MNSNTGANPELVETYKCIHPGRVVLFMFCAGAFVLGCRPPVEKDIDHPVALAIEWNRCMLEAEVVSEGFRGPVAARTYGYVGIAAYEAGLPGFEGDYQSMSIHFPDIELPAPPVPSLYNQAIALNSCYSTIIGRFFLASPEPVRQKRVRLEEKWNQALTRGMDPDIVEASQSWGREVALVIYLWSSTDSLGYRSNHHNYDRAYHPPTGEGQWVSSTDFPMPPLLPYWGNVRPFFINKDDYLASPLPAFSNETNQPYSVQALELIALTRSLSSENKSIAKYWNDDHPGVTFTPPGHWLEITNQVIENESPALEKTLETYLRIGVVLTDVMIAAFYSKYVYNLERPETYIQRNLDKSWRPLSPSPSFPAYPSGHAMMGAAAAEVLTSMYGDSYTLVDRSHALLPHSSIPSRTFPSFEEMAKENALSRILLGVHWRMDCEEGLRLGAILGDHISQIDLRKAN